MVCRAAHLQPQTSSPVLRGQTPDNPQLGLRTTRRRIGWRNGTKNRDDDASLPCCVAAKYAPIAADSTVRVGARRGQRQYASSPRALPITATIKTLIYPFFRTSIGFHYEHCGFWGEGRKSAIGCSGDHSAHFASRLDIGEPAFLFSHNYSSTFFILRLRKHILTLD